MRGRIREIWQRFKVFWTRHIFSSFRSTVLSVYIPLIIAFILVTGIISYTLAVRQVEESTRSEAANLVHQTRLYTDSRFQAILEQMTALSDDPVILQLLSKQASEITPQDYLAVQSHVDTIRLYNSSIIDTVYIDLNHGNFRFYRGDDDYADLLHKYELYQNMTTGEDEEQPEILWKVVGVPQNGGGQESGMQTVDVLRRIGRHDSEKKGILVFRLREEFFSSMMDRPLLSGRGYLAMVGPEGSSNTVSSVPQNMRPDAQTLKDIYDSETTDGYIEFKNLDGEWMVAVYDTLATNGWKLAAVFRRDALLDKVVYIKYTTFAAILILMILAVFVTNQLSSRIMRPLSDLVDRMKKMRHGAITAPSVKSLPARVITDRPPNEVEILGHGVDDLMGHVRDLMAQVKKDQEMQRELELAVVQMQVHPHFLYNTLFAIKGLCDMGMNEEASKMIMALANFFRIGLSHGREIIPVSQEVDHARNYLYIQEMRYGDVFAYHFSIAPDIGDYSIIKLTLQPLVENAIYHGVKEKRGKGNIAVTGWMEDGMLHFTVEDDGMGMTEERLTELRRGLAESRLGKKHVGFGVFSVFERLRLHYGEEAGLEITSEQGKGTCVHVMLPAQKLGETEHA